jgi:alpha-glucoside transport system substrate-binding protein
MGRLGVTLAMLAIVVGAGAGAAQSPAQIGGEVTVIGAWGGSEEESFRAMVAPFEQSTGVTVKYVGTRALNEVISTGIASGLLPDLAGLPGPGQMIEYAEQGLLIPLNDVLDIEAYRANTAPSLVELGTVNDQVVGVFIKAAVKGLIWFNPAHYTAGEPSDWEDLAAKVAEAASAAGPDTRWWCVGLESAASSGWPGTDWIEDFVLRQSGPEVYDAWVAGTHPWTSPEIRQAFESFGQVVAPENVFGGPETVLATAFGDAGAPLFTDPPGCIFHHQASFITDFFRTGGATDADFDFFPFPQINPDFAGALEGAGDLFGMFNDTPQSRALMAYLVTPEAQQIWVDRGGALSANTQVTTYPDEIAQRSAELLASAEIFRFDASDLMPEAMNNAFWTAILDFTQDQSRLDSILQTLDQVQADAYAS